MSFGVTDEAEVITCFHPGHVEPLRYNRYCRLVVMTGNACKYAFCEYRTYVHALDLPGT